VSARKARSLRLDELLFRRAVEGLEASEQRELDTLLAREPDVDSAIYDRAAAAVCMGALAGAKLPAGLRAGLQDAAGTILKDKGRY